MQKPANMAIQDRREVVQRKFCCIKWLKDNKFVKHAKLSDCRAKNCALCNGIHHVLVCLEPTGEQIVHKATKDGSRGEDAYGPDEDIFNNGDRHFKWDNHQPSGPENGEG